MSIVINARPTGRDTMESPSTHKGIYPVLIAGNPRRPAVMDSNGIETNDSAGGSAPHYPTIREALDATRIITPTRVLVGFSWKGNALLEPTAGFVSCKPFLPLNTWGLPSRKDEFAKPLDSQTQSTDFDVLTRCPEDQLPDEVDCGVLLTLWNFPDTANGLVFALKGGGTIGEITAWVHVGKTPIIKMVCPPQEGTTLRVPAGLFVNDGNSNVRHEQLALRPMGIGNTAALADRLGMV